MAVPESLMGWLVLAEPRIRRSLPASFAHRGSVFVGVGCLPGYLLAADPNLSAIEPPESHQ
jgi:hypothetical protein